MVELKFTKEMLELLCQLKGETLVSYSYDKDLQKVVLPQCYVPSSYLKTRLETSIGVIGLTNEEGVQPWFEGTTEGIAGFACHMAEEGENFCVFDGVPLYTYAVNKKIVGVEIINDYVNINDGEYIITFDQALIFRFEDGSVLMFSRTAWFHEDIIITWHDNYDKLFSVQQMMESLNDDGEDDTKVTRTRKIL